MRTNLKHRLARLEQRHRPPRLPAILLKMIGGQRYRQTGELVTEADMKVLLATHSIVITIGPVAASNRTPSDS